MPLFAKGQPPLPGRADPIETAATHFVHGVLLQGPYPAHLTRILVGMGCFWGVERLFWGLDGVHVTAAGYAGGSTPNPTYDELCTGRTGHAEVVQILFDPEKLPFAALLKLFWEEHDPTQGNRQGNDVGTQYRSALYLPASLLETARASAARYGAALAERGLGPVTTEIAPMPEFYFAESAHQQYLAKNPGGYCGLRGTGVACAGDHS